MRSTTNYNFNLPDGIDRFNLSHQEQNWIKADTEIKALNTGKINLSIFTAVNDFIVGNGVSTVIKKTPTEVKTILSINNVTNESKATMFTSAALTGTPTAPTAAVGTNTTQIATTAFVNSEIANDAILKSTVTTLNDFIVATGSAAVTRKTPTEVKTIIGLSNVDNTSDASKPISTATQTALNGKLDNAHAGATGGAHGVATTAVAGFMSSTDKTKLDGVATGANNYTHPANHPPSIITQDASNRFVTDAEKSTWNGKQAALGFTPENSANKGVANGYASLGADGKVPSAQLPSFVDDVLEFANFASFPATGETGKIYVALDNNKTYRWSGSAYVYITSGAVDSVAGKTGVVTLVKGDVGLGSVDNTADSAKNVLSATKLTTARTITLTGDVTSSAVSFDGSANISITATVTDDSHNHVIANVDGLQTDLDAKLTKTHASELYMGNRNLNWVGGGEMRWGIVANTFSWAGQMRIIPGGGKMLVDGVAITNILIAAGSVVLANAWDCAYITLPATDGATVTLSVAQFNAIPAGNDKLILAIRDADSCLEMLGGGWVTYGTIVEAGGKRDTYIPKSLVTAANDFIIATGSGVVAKKTLAETKTILGISNVTNESKATMFTSPALTGTPTAPTAADTVNTTQIATTAYVKSQRVKSTSTIPAAGWVANTGDYPLKYNLAIAGVVVGDWVEVTIDKDYLDTAANAEICSTVDEYAGGITLYAKTAPTVNIPIRYMVVK